MPQHVEELSAAYSLSLPDRAENIYYLDSENYRIEAIFGFESNEFKENDQAVLMNFLIRNDTPDDVAEAAGMALVTIINYSFENQISLDDLSSWVFTNTDPGNLFRLPGYDLSILKSDEYTQYMILPPAEQNPFVRAPAGAPAEEDLVTVRCEEQSFSLRIPAGAAAEPAAEYGGLCVYGGEPGSVPYIDVFRRPVALKNPADYLDNTVRENMEKQYGNQVSFEPCKTVPVGGHSLYSAVYRYTVQGAPMYLNVLVWNGIEEAVEFHVRYREAEQDAILLLLDTVVRYYSPDDL